ncbi:radical SAM protein [Chondromyces crocatus]|nr:radical SAM protein [Chondromyces crocatus]
MTNETCNHNCAFCHARRPAERPDVAAAGAVLARIDAAARGGARTLVLTGGEPALRRDLPALVTRARRALDASARPGDFLPDDPRAQPAQVLLETNGALITPARADALRRAGLDVARVHLPRWGDALDTITRDDGGFARTLAGLHALAAAGVALEVSIPLVLRTLATAPEIPTALHAAGLPVRALVLTVPVTAPDPADLATLPDVARAAEAVDAAARRAGIPARFDVGALIPPCLFQHPNRAAHLYTFTPGGAARPDFDHPDACTTCQARSICPGVPREALRRDPQLALRPIRDERTRRRLTVVSSIDDQIRRELCTRDVRRLADGTTVREHIVRINFHCNQVCRFCFVSTHLPMAPEPLIEDAITEIARAGGVLTLSGGEPTLNPRVVDYVTLGKQLGAREIELQTNATRLADPALTRALADAGLDVAFVSLHAAQAAVSDRITGAPGTFDKTVRGLDELAKTSVLVRINFVFCEQNQEEFPALVALTADRWPRAEITVSFVAASTDLVPLTPDILPRYGDVLPYLAEGVHLARERGVTLTGFESMCGIPLCLVPADLARYFALAQASTEVAPGEFLKPDDTCGTCALTAQCFGIRRGYAKLYGTTELRPIRALAAEGGPAADA